MLEKCIWKPSSVGLRPMEVSLFCVVILDETHGDDQGISVNVLLFVSNKKVLVENALL
jgi:hypothetical protein